MNTTGLSHITGVADMRFPRKLTRRERIRLNLTRYWIDQGPSLMARVFILIWLITIAASFIHIGTLR
jgi:hypothetical protein